MLHLQLQKGRGLSLAAIYGETDELLNAASVSVKRGLCGVVAATVWETQVQISTLSQKLAG